MRHEHLRNGSLFQILLQSIALFRSSSNADVTIIVYPELEQDFVEFQIEQNQDEVPDLRLGEVVNDLIQTCMDMQNSKTYELLPQDKNERKSFPTKYATCEDLTESRTIEDLVVSIGEFEEEVTMLLCYNDPKFGNIYITPGFGGEFNFLFQQGDEQEHPEIYGLVEITPLVDDWFLDQRHLEKFFLQAYRMYDSSPKSELSLSMLNDNQRYRLCSLIEDARDQARQETDEEAETSNTKSQADWQRRRVETIEEVYDVTFREIDKLNPVYATLDTVISVLSCYTNGGALVFLVSEDPLDASAVFVFEESTNPESERREIYVVQHVSDIAFLRNMDKFY